MATVQTNDSNLYILNDPSAYCAPHQCMECTTVVHGVHYPSAQDAPKKETIKKNNKKEPLNNATRGNFNNFEQRDYDMDKLEKKLLGWE